MSISLSSTKNWRFLVSSSRWNSKALIVLQLWLRILIPVGHTAADLVAVWLTQTSQQKGWWWRVVLCRVSFMWQTRMMPKQSWKRWEKDMSSCIPLDIPNAISSWWISGAVQDVCDLQSNDVLPTYYLQLLCLYLLLLHFQWLLSIEQQDEKSPQSLLNVWRIFWFELA